MTEQERRDYAAHLVLEHAREVEFLSVHEMWSEYVGDEDAELSEEDALAVHDLIPTSSITVSWPDTAGGAS